MIHGFSLVLLYHPQVAPTRGAMHCFVFYTSRGLLGMIRLVYTKKMVDCLLVTTSTLPLLILKVDEIGRGEQQE